MKSFAAVATIAFVCVVALMAAADSVSSDQTPAKGDMRTRLNPLTTGLVTSNLIVKDNNAVITKNNIFLSKSDRVTLAHTVESVVSTDMEAKKDADAMTKNILGLVADGDQDKILMTHASGIVQAAKTGDQSARARQIAASVNSITLTQDGKDTLPATTKTGKRLSE
ncbi:hypothetical protein BBJ28_00019164 [Nothophytophthora sp. Chile5]|nr:hypothetical protein BBJ28_00019164 [Nothophytophthora sp. Chile5]